MSRSVTSTYDDDGHDIDIYIYIYILSFQFHDLIHHADLEQLKLNKLHSSPCLMHFWQYLLLEQEGVMDLKFPC